MTSIGPRYVVAKSSLIRRFVASLIWIRPGSLCDSIREAVLTVSPQMSYWNLRVPMTPATAGPELIPIRNDNGPWAA